MQTELWPYVVISLASTFLASVSQVMLKKAANRKYDNIIKEYLNPLVIVAYVIFFGTTLLGLWAYKILPISLGAVLEATAYIYVTFFGVIIFKEKLTPKRVIALIMIVSGVVIFALG